MKKKFIKSTPKSTEYRYEQQKAHAILSALHPKLIVNMEEKLFDPNDWNHKPYHEVFPVAVADVFIRNHPRINVQKKCIVVRLMGDSHWSSKKQMKKDADQLERLEGLGYAVVDFDSREMTELWNQKSPVNKLATNEVILHFLGGLKKYGKLLPKK